MSLILEALRKSEAERRRGQAPDVAVELPPTPAVRARHSAWWLLPAAIVIGLFALIGWWTRHDRAAVAPPATAARPTTAVPTSNNTDHAALPRMRSAPIPPPAADPAATAWTSSEPSLAAKSATSSATELRRQPNQPIAAARTPAPRSGSPARDAGNDIADAIQNDASLLPPIKLSMLMWDDVPSRRFVILNGQRMAEGDRQGGIAVVAIERDAVVVETAGSRARVPLP